MKINFQGYVDTLEELQERHRLHLKPFQDFVNRLAQKTQGRAANPPMKDATRCASKALFKYVDSLGKVSWFRLTDIARDTLLYESLGDMYDAAFAIGDDSDIKIIEFTDRYQSPLEGGYCDLQLTVQFRTIVCELQLNTRLMCAVKQSIGHRMFEARREVKAAVAAGDVERCRQILEWGHQNLGEEASMILHELFNDPSTRLMHQAAANGSADILSCFLDYGADANVRDLDQRSPLHEAMAGGHERAIWALIDKGQANLTTHDKNGMPPLMDGLVLLRTRPEDERVARCVSLLGQCAGTTHMEEVQAQLNAYLETRYTNSAELVTAAFDGNLVKVRQLLCDFANPHSINIDGTFALCTAVEHGHREVASLLLSAKANPDYERTNGRTALMVASAKKDTCMMQVLLESKANPNEQGDGGRPALMVAIDKEDTSLMRMLLESKANPNQQDNDGRTPLMIATDNNSVISVMRVLLEFKADIDQQDNDGCTALMAAVDNDDFTMTNRLLDFKADIDQQDSNGRTALMSAAETYNFNMTELLLESKANIDQQDNNGRTALMIATCNEGTSLMMSLMRMLLESKANPNEQGDGGRTALMAAVANKDTSMMQVLLESKANIDQPDMYCRTALVVAIDNNDTSVM